MTEDFLQRPLAGRIGEAADTLLVQGLDEQDGLSPLRGQGRDGIVADEPYIITHPEFREFIVDRHERMMAGFDRALAFHG